MFAINELLIYRKQYAQTIQQLKKDGSPEDTLRALMDLTSILSIFGGVLNRFERFTTPAQQTVVEQNYRYVPVKSGSSKKDEEK